MTRLAGKVTHVILVGNVHAKMAMLDSSARSVHLCFIVHHQTRNVQVSNASVVTVILGSVIMNYAYELRFIVYA